MLDKPCRWGIALTYRCNTGCKGCNRFLDVAPWKDSDLTLNDIREGYNRVVESGEPIKKVRVTGGEPLLHPNFVDCVELIGETWNKQYREGGARTCVFTSVRKDLPKPNGWRYRGGRRRKQKFFPVMVSPDDLKMDWTIALKFCHIQKSCGRLFDAYGFAFCVLAAPIGRMLGIDPYEAKPSYKARAEICRHCVYSVGFNKARNRIKNRVRKGDIPSVTPTYRKALDSGGMMQFKKFRDR